MVSWRFLCLVILHNVQLPPPKTVTRNVHLKWKPKTTGNANGGIDPPHTPSNIRTRSSPPGHANKREHVDNGSEPHRQCAKEERLNGVVDHQLPRRRINEISQSGHDEDEREQDDVQDEENDAEDVEGPVMSGVKCRKGMEEN